MGADNVSASLLQWMVAAVDHGYVITASLWTMELPQRVSELEACIERFEPGRLP